MLTAVKASVHRLDFQPGLNEQATELAWRIEASGHPGLRGLAVSYEGVNGLCSLSSWVPLSRDRDAASLCPRTEVPQNELSVGLVDYHSATRLKCTGEAAKDGQIVQIREVSEAALPVDRGVELSVKADLSHVALEEFGGNVFPAKSPSGAADVACSQMHPSDV